MNRRAVAHVHACPECFDYAPCGLPCTLTPDLDPQSGLAAASPCVCRTCLKRAGLPLDTFTTSIVDTLEGAAP